MHNSVDHFICLPNNGPTNNGHMTDASDHIYAVVNTSDGPQRARILRSSSNRDSSGSMLSSSSAVSSCVVPNQRPSDSTLSKLSNIEQKNFGSNKVAPNLIDLIPPPPTYPPPTHADGSSGMPMVSFSVQPSIHKITSAGILQYCYQKRYYTYRIISLTNSKPFLCFNIFIVIK